MKSLIGFFVISLFLLSSISAFQFMGGDTIKWGNHTINVTRIRNMINECYSAASGSECSILNSTCGCALVMKQIEYKKQTRNTYEITIRKEGRFLGLFRKKIETKTYVDPLTGEIILEKKPWYMFLMKFKEENS